MLLLSQIRSLNQIDLSCSVSQAPEKLPKKTKLFFAHAAENWDAAKDKIALFYVAVLAGLLHRFPYTAGQLRNRKSGTSGGAKVSEQGESITFGDVAGVDEAKEELEEIVEFLRNPDRYIRLGAHPPRGVLLIDVVAKSRDGRFRVVSNDEREQTLNQLLTVSLLEAIDLILQGAQNLVVPIKSNSRRKLQDSPRTHNGCEFC
ncbi:hypothetical protein LOK49_LG15G02354 [Camellia lanceoleosa]|uniref:Uncharacterized protein n=1 Tax=Camellia lanceoleosa TaxID=1840588 RepID=A0ACC0F3D4_9ERIC|nr:hypothetical protein LOK49_LG15G02354 [Camellia lanceoleosa]